MNIRCVSVLVICFISSFTNSALCTLGTNAFLSWGSSSSDNDVQNEKPQISLSCLLYGNVGCQKTCQLTALLYGCDTNPECRDNLYCVCNEVYHMASGDLTTNDFQKMPFDTLWDNTFENTSQASAIRRYIKKNDEMSELVDILLRDPRVNGEEIKNQLMFKYPDLSSEFKKLISVKRGMKSDLMTGDHLKYEDILDHFNELVTGIQNSDNELQNIKYRRRIAKILESVQDENELGHLVDLVKLSHNDSLYNYVTTVLKKRGFVFDNNENNYATPFLGTVLSDTPDSQFHATNVIREHNLGTEDINEGDMIELSVIANLGQPSAGDAYSPIQVNADENNQQCEAQQIPSAAYIDEAVQTEIPNAAYTDGTSRVQTSNIAYPQLDLSATPQGQTSSAAYTEVFGGPADIFSLSDAVAKIQTDLASLDNEVSQLKSASLGVDFSAISDMMNSANFGGPLVNVDKQFSQSPQLNLDLNSISQVLDGNLTQQNSGFDEGIATVMNALLNSNAVGTPDASEIEFINNIPMYMAQVAAAPVAFPDGVTVSKIMSSSLPVVVPSAIENSVQYTISKKIRRMQDGEFGPNVSTTNYSSVPETVTTTVEEATTPQTQTNVEEPKPLDPEKISTTDSILVNGNFPNKLSPQPTTTNTSSPTPKRKSSPTNTDTTTITENVTPTENQVIKKAKIVSTNSPKNELTTTESVTTYPKNQIATTETVTTSSPKKQIATTGTETTNPKNQIATTETVTTSSPKEQIATTETVTTNPKNQIATTETVSTTNNPADVAKTTKVTRKANTISKETKNPQAAPALVKTDINQVNLSPLPGATVVSSLETAVNANKLEEEVNMTEDPTVLQSLSTVKKKKPQLSQSKKNGDQVESSVRSVSLTQTENLADDSALVSLPNTESSQTTETVQTVTKTETTSTQSSTTTEESANSVLDDATATPVVAQEAISPFGRFGLDQVKRFANSFKKSSGS